MGLFSSCKMAFCSKKPTILLLLSGFIFIITSLPYEAAAADITVTDPLEVTALRTIAKKFHIASWNFDVDPCSGNNGWNNTASGSPGVLCVCNNNSCHISQLFLENMELLGQIPEEIANLTHLNSLQMGLNLLSGGIPAVLGQLGGLQYIDIAINQLTGPLPVEFGNLTTLVSMGIGSNGLEGKFPRELGNLKSLTDLYMDGCGLGGQIPSEFGNLTSLNTLWMFDNPFSGSIPMTFGNLKMLKSLKLYGNNLDGPLPPSLLTLPSLTEMMIGDLSFGGTIPSSFKDLQSLTVLSLRNNQMNGSIPDDLGGLKNLTYLDLSFNQLTGTIPASLRSLKNLQSLYLGNNLLTGSLPIQLGELPYLARLDLSYNQLTGEIPSWVNKSVMDVNLIWNSFTETNENNRYTFAAFNCLDTSIPCHRTTTGKSTGFAINCGGPSVKALSTETVYDDDSEHAGDSNSFMNVNGKWGVSTTGHLQDPNGNFLNNVSTSTNIQGTFDQKLYQTARSSASSLRYYGIGLANGMYTVELHFAEIYIYSTTWKSLGKRIFDVYLQGVKVLKDFDIRTAGNGSYIAVMKTFQTKVDENFLEIHLHWSGKGTCCIPTPWTYGPLISAIRVYSNFTVDSTSSSASISGAARAGIIAAVIFSIFLLFAMFIYCRKRHILVKMTDDNEFESIEATAHVFTYNELKLATNGFHPQNKLGEGGFGTVFKGVLPDGTIVAVKQILSRAKQGKDEFMNEVATISSVQHRNLVRLLGCCVESEQQILVFEFLENNSLFQALLGPQSKRFFLDWKMRFNICLGVTRGLAYLHEGSRTRIVHRDIKASNILLDKNLSPKIADFGLAKLFQDDKTHISTRVAGTIGYLAPEYALRGQLTEKADVYSFGVLLLEIISGRSNIDTKLPDEMVFLLEWTWQLYEEKRPLALIDKELHENYSEQEALRVIHVALLCTQSAAQMRPKMSDIVSMLYGNSAIDLQISRPGFLADMRQASLASSLTTESSASSTTQSAPLTISIVEPR